MLAISAVIIFFCTKSSNAKKFRYPKVDCDIIANEYDNDVLSTSWIIDAENEYASNIPK